MSVQKIAVIGGGTMGSGIALTAAINDLQAVVVDISDDQLSRAATYHKKQLARAVAKERMTQEEADTALQNLSYVTNMKDASDADWVLLQVAGRM